MKPAEVLGWLFWRVGPVLLIVWAVRSGAIDYQKYVRLVRGETKSPVQMQLEALGNLMVEDFKQDKPVPQAYQFSYWLLQHPRANALGPRPHTDPFGNTIRLTTFFDGFTLTSDGPDRKANTPDDIAHTVTELQKKKLEQ